MGIKYTGTPKGLEAFLVRPLNKINNNEAYKQFVKADALRITNHFRESIKHYLSSILIDRKNYRAYYGLGISYKAEYEYEKAVDMFEKSIKLSFYQPLAHRELGICYLYLNKPEDALNSLRTSITMDRTDFSAQIQLGIAHEMLEEFEMAAMIYQAIIDNDPNNLDAYTHLSALYMRLEQCMAAGSVFTHMLKINPDFYKAHLGLAICFDKMQNPQRAVHYYKSFMDKKPHSRHCSSVKNRIKKLQNERTAVCTEAAAENKTHLVSL